MKLPSGIELPVDQIAALCRRYYVKELRVFGSAARKDMRPDSDIDLLVEFEEGRRVGLLHYSRLMVDLSALLGRPVDLVQSEALRPRIRSAVEREAVKVYASGQRAA